MKNDKKSVIILISAALIVFAATIIIFILDTPKYNDIGEISIKPASSASETETIKNESFVNINTADEDELTKLFGIGEKRAADIVEYREKNGKFRTIEEITNIDGISKSVLEKNSDIITV